MLTAGHTDNDPAAEVWEALVTMLAQGRRHDDGEWIEERGGQRYHSPATWEWIEADRGGGVIACRKPGETTWRVPAGESDRPYAPVPAGRRSRAQGAGGQDRRLGRVGATGAARVPHHVLRAFAASGRAADITYIRLRHGWLYLVAILDWFSRYVVSWSLDETLELAFVLDAIAQARARALPEIWNTDQGSHFTSPQVTEPLAAAGVQISMDGKGRATDNSFTERLWRSLKYEEVYLADYGSPRDARAGLARYFTFYNTEWPHQALDYRRPAELYLQ